MKVQIVTFSKEAGWGQHETTLENLLETAKELGYTHEGQSQRHSLLTREELINKPKFAELCGPMYGGEGCLRYENWAAYEKMSA